MKTRILKVALLAVIMAAGLATTANAQGIIIIIIPIDEFPFTTFDVQSLYSGPVNDMYFGIANHTGATWTDFHLFGSSIRHGGESGDGSLYIVDNSYDGIGTTAYSGGIVEGYSTDLTITDIEVPDGSVLPFHISTVLPEGSSETAYLNAYPTTGQENPIPEPGTLLLVGLGLAGAGLRRRFKS
jgi:hypothetical protein